jgi:hypothetical protein
VKRFYFAFSSSNSHRALNLLKRGFQHVEMITELDDGHTVMHLNPLWGRVDMGITSEHSLSAVLQELQRLGRTIVMYRCEDPDPRAKIKRGPVMTCAAYLAYTIGLPFGGVTPYQLYKTIMAQGGQEL